MCLYLYIIMYPKSEIQYEENFSKIKKKQKRRTKVKLVSQIELETFEKKTRQEQSSESVGKCSWDPFFFF